MIKKPKADTFLFFGPVLKPNLFRWKCSVSENNKGPPSDSFIPVWSLSLCYKIKFASFSIISHTGTTRIAHAPVKLTFQLHALSIVVPVQLIQLINSHYDLQPRLFIIFSDCSTIFSFCQTLLFKITILNLRIYHIPVFAPLKRLNIPINLFYAAGTRFYARPGKMRSDKKPVAVF